jgi:uncharacterized membrane protein (DUF106 family)
MSVMGLPGYAEMIIWASLLSLFMVILTKLLTDQEMMRRIKADMKEFNEKIKRAQKAGKTDEANKLTSQMLKMSSKQMQQSMKPMIVSMGIFFVAIWFFGTYYGELTVAVPVNLPFLGNSLNWFWWYFIVIFGTNFLFRKLLDVA